MKQNFRIRNVQFSAKILDPSDLIMGTGPKRKGFPTITAADLIRARKASMAGERVVFMSMTIFNCEEPLLEKTGGSGYTTCWQSAQSADVAASIAHGFTFCAKQMRCFGKSVNPGGKRV